MREYGQIQCAFWSDPDVQDMSDQGKLLGAYLLTGPHSNGLGCYRLPDEYVSADFGWSSETLSKAFRELFDMGFCKRCERTKYVLIHKFLRWNPISNGNVAKARQKEFELVSKKTSIHSDLAREMLDYGNHFEKGFETLLKGYAKQEPDPEKTQTLPGEGEGKDPEPEKDPELAPSDETLDAAAPPDSLVVERVPLNTGKSHPVTEADVAEYERLYPAVDVRQSLRSIRGWCDANPQKRKTASGVKAFITRWISKEQDRGGNVTPPSGPSGPNGKPYSRNQGAADQAARELEQEMRHGHH